MGKVKQVISLEHMRIDFPPTVLIHVKKDRLVLSEKSRRPWERLNACGVQAESIEVEGADHMLGKENPPKLAVGAMEAQRKALAFVLNELRA